MKGLLLQDYYIMKKNLLITCGICLYFLFILLLGSSDATDFQIDMILYTVFGVVSCFLTSCSYLTIDHNRDKKSSLFIRACPLTKEQIVFEKYLITYILFLGGTCTVFIFALINHWINGYRPQKNFPLILFIIFSVILIFTHIELPVTMRFGQAAASGVLISFICLLIVFGLMAIIKISLSDTMSQMTAKLFDHRMYLVAIFSASDIVTGVLSYTASKYN